MKRAVMSGIWAATLIFFSLTALAETLTYYDCRKKDGTMSYRIFPCDAGQQEIHRQENTLDVAGENHNAHKESAVVWNPEHAISTLEVQAINSAQRAFAMGEATYKLGKLVDAATWYGEAAEQGYAPAQYSLGVMYEKDQGVTQDYTQAVSWYRKAAEQGFALAQFSMGVMYDIGQGVAQDYQQARSWYTRAAERGNVKAQNNIGFMYSQGKGVAQNYVTAHMWFNIAGGLGYEDGRKNREFVEKLMTPSQIAEAQRQASEWMKAHP